VHPILRLHFGATSHRVPANTEAGEERFQSPPRKIEHDSQQKLTPEKTLHHDFSKTTLRRSEK
jgi:hypothetical protein